MLCWPDLFVDFMETMVYCLLMARLKALWADSDSLSPLTVLVRDLIDLSHCQLSIFFQNFKFPTFQENSQLYCLQEGRSVNARLYIAAFSHILETSIIFHRFRYMMPLPVQYIPKPYFLF